MANNRSQGILGFIGLLAVCAGLGYGAWVALTRPRLRSGQQMTARLAPANDSMGFVSVAAEGVDLELVAPDGARSATSGGVAGALRIAGAEPSVDCPGFADPGGKESACTASINVIAPAAGDYTIIARATASRAVTLNIGWATASETRRGAFDVRVQVARGGATSFAIIVGRDAVSQRTEPRPIAP